MQYNGQILGILLGIKLSPAFSHLFISNAEEGMLKCIRSYICYTDGLKALTAALIPTSSYNCLRIHLHEHPLSVYHSQCKNSSIRTTMCTALRPTQFPCKDNSIQDTQEKSTLNNQLPRQEYILLWENICNTYHC